MDGLRTSRVLLSESQIAERVKELGYQISLDYEAKDLMVVGILRGSFIFLADLARNITVPLSIDFIALSSYGSSTQSSGKVKMLKDLDAGVEGKHVLLVEDIVDTGWTLSMSDIVNTLLSRGAESVRVCTLLDKPDRRRVDVEIHYVGFTIPDEFVVGYGLDFDGKYRNLPCVCTVDITAAG